MRVGEVCKRDVVTVRREDPLLEAAARFDAERTPAIVVVDHCVPVGLLTEASVVNAILAGGAASVRSLAVGDAKLEMVLVADEQEDVTDVLKRMRKVSASCVAVTKPSGE